MLLSAGIALAATPESPWANVGDPVFFRIDQKALPHPAVYAVTQDASGFIWIGTPGGLARYDGYQFRTFPDAPNSVQALIAAPDDKLWIGTPSKGLAMLDERTERFRAWHADPNGHTGPRSATVIALARNADGKLWIGGDSGLDLFDPATNTFQPFDLATDERQPRVEAILIDHEQTVWIATVHGLFLRDRGEKNFRRYTDFEKRSFFSLHEDASHRVWLGSAGDVFVLGLDRKISHTYALSGEQWGIVEVTPGIFWVAAYDGGITIIESATQHIRRIAIDRASAGGFTPGDVWQFFRDRSGLIWIANGPGGLLAYNPLNRGIFELSSIDKGLGAGDIGARTVASAPNGDLWLGGADRVLRVDPRTGASKAFTVPDRRSVQTLSVGPDETLWIGTIQGLCRLDTMQEGIDCPSGIYQDVGRVFAVLENGGKLWVGTGTGVVALDRRTGVTTRFRHGNGAESLSNDFVTVLYGDRAGRIWVGTSNGVNLIDPATSGVTQFAAGSVSSVVQDRRGRMWIAAIGGPLNVLTERPNGGADLRRLGRAEGLPENVSALAEGPDGSMWASVTGSLAHIDPNSFGVHILGMAEGVQETEFWTRGVTTASDGTIFFAGTHAVTVIAPDALVEWNYAPPVAITALNAGGKTIAGWRPGGRPVELRAGARDITVEFAALDYSGPDALRYSYMLEGYNHSWTVADGAHRIATYTNLSPGNYTLRVRATNRAGKWSSSNIALELHALPAWYETWWFRALLAFALVILILLVVRMRTALLRQRAAQLEATVAERTSELAVANAALENMTITDALTGLRNRRFLMQRIDEEIALVLRQKSDLIFFLIDIDHFKAVNDNLGHAAGDRVLQQMRERLEKVFRSSDYILRWGGEEFLVMTRGSSRADAPEIAERLRRCIAEDPFNIDGVEPLAKTASIGFAAFPFIAESPRAISWTQVVDLADQALYVAKNGGRNTWAGIAAMPGADASAIANGAVELLRPPTAQQSAAAS